MLRSIRFVGLALLVAASAACSSSTEEVEGSGSAVVDVRHTPVERQSIGNCWIYAQATWVESMHLSATGEAFDISQSYWTYMHWFDQIVADSGSEIETGGGWSEANSIIARYGLVSEHLFVDADSAEEMSARQAAALTAINTSLKTGALKTPEARRNRTLVRREMDSAWNLSSSAKEMLNAAFGNDLGSNFSTGASSAGTPILRAQDFAVSYATGRDRPLTQKKLIDAIREWHREFYGWSDRREFEIRVQKAMHAQQPVIITWLVDFNALENTDPARLGSFNLTTLNRNGPGRQGGHMTVLEDYEATLDDGTVLAAGVTLDPTKAEDAAKLARALKPSTTLTFLRVKNSWGTARPDRAFAPGMPGYHDLYMDYLDGPVKKCAKGPNGETDTSNCYDETPLNYVVLPPGF